MDLWILGSSYCLWPVTEISRRVGCCFQVATLALGAGPQGGGAWEEWLDLTWMDMDGIWFECSKPGTWRICQTCQIYRYTDIQDKILSPSVGWSKVAISGHKLRQTVIPNISKQKDLRRSRSPCARWHLSLQAMQSIRHLAQLNGVLKPRSWDVGVQKWWGIPRNSYFNILNW